MRSFTTTSFLIAAFILASPKANSQITDLPQSAQNILREYQRSVSSASTRAVQQLQLIKKSETQRGNLEAALAIEKKIEEISLNIDQSTLSGKSYVIKSTSAVGTSIGPAKQGQRVIVQYISGAWKLIDGGERISPDETSNLNGRVALVGVSQGKRENITLIPCSTAKTGFVTTIPVDCEELFLVCTDTAHDDNAGSVTYRVGIR